MHIGTDYDHFVFINLSLNQVNMSIAILPMAAEFNWNPATMGLIQSSFFWGYLLTQVCCDNANCFIFILCWHSYLEYG